MAEYDVVIRGGTIVDGTGRIGIPKPLFSPRAAAASPVAAARLPRPRAMTPCWAPRRRGVSGLRL
jgi:hypothetical protein